MSWLKNSSIGASLGKLRGTSSPSKEFDSSACYDSFREHWQQICEIFEKTKVPGSSKRDDVLGVVYNLDHMVTLLVLELRSTNPNRPCLEHILNENLLDRLYSWSLLNHRYENVLKLEQLKLYEVLVSHSHTQLLDREPFHRPLLNLLASCSDVCFSVVVEKRLVVLLNQLCVSLVHHNDLLSLFFDNKNIYPPKFIIFSLLIPFVHREGALGQQARDALLLCMALSKHNEPVAEFITRNSNVCPVLAAGLSGLYSLLPRKLTIETNDWHRLTPDDVNDLPELAVFMNSLEFCNAVVQVAHPIVQNHLLEFLYQGFLVPVMGPALLQSAEQELTAATAYFDLFLRSLSEPGLLYSFIKVIIKETYDGQRIIDSLIQRISCKSTLCLVTLALLETLVDLNCEDVMLELVFRHLIPCNHVMASQRSRLNHTDPYCRSAEKLLQLSPNIQRYEASEGSLYGDYQAYLTDVRAKINSCILATSVWTYTYDGENPPNIGFPMVHTCIESEAEHSLPSADDGSSGYESFARMGEMASESGSGGECDSPSGSEICNDLKPNIISCFNTTPTIGPFLEAVFNKLENMLTHNLYVNLHITGLISRLAIYPQPLLRSFLLDHSLVFQPSIKSLFQIIGWLKQHIENELRDAPPHLVRNLIIESEAILIERENKVVNARKYALQASSLPHTTVSEPFERGETSSKNLHL
ncbi:hypothetical protein AAG570_008198 [Ranatra chinensis]|uniref:FHF complex subunit HOOK-interacting protein C-terminal domain-containing protein n=1 Tax=Ranatra chinensis TaxID=642074 RepID=A0ABD0XSG0_9HEMI